MLPSSPSLFGRGLLGRRAGRASARPARPPREGSLGELDAGKDPRGRALSLLLVDDDRPPRPVPHVERRPSPVAGLGEDPAPSSEALARHDGAAAQAAAEDDAAAALEIQLGVVVLGRTSARLDVGAEPLDEPLDVSGVPLDA